MAAPRIALCAPLLLAIWIQGAAAVSVGIDLGTSSSAVAYLPQQQQRQQQPTACALSDWRVVPLGAKGEATSPSLVFVRADGSVSADAVAASSPVRAWKRTVGLEASCVEWRLSKREAQTLRLDDGSRHKQGHVMLTTRVGDRDVALDPAACSRALLDRLLRATEAHLGERVDKAVLGAPASYLPSQREALMSVARSVGLEQVQIVSEPELAAHAYGLGLSPNAPESLALVVDLGGGTLDVSFVLVGGETRTIEVVATSGDSCLGGVDFTAAIAAGLAKQHPASEGDIFAAAEIAKIELTTRARTEVLGSTITRAEFEDSSAPLLQRLANCVRQAAVLAGADLPGDSLTETPTPNRRDTRVRRNLRNRRKSAVAALRDVRPVGEPLRFWPSGNSRQVDDLILVGAATRMPAVQRTLIALTGCRLNKPSIEPELAVAFGAAIRAATNDNAIPGDDLVVFDAYQAEVLRHFAKSSPPR